jgi:molybdopterin converting factor small subunit
VRDALQPRHPEAFALVSVVAVDGERVRDEPGPPLSDGCEIVFMSRFSGG